jgi:hypothetical protein
LGVRGPDAGREEIEMKKSLKKLTLHRETVCSLNDLCSAAGGVYTEKTVCATACVTNCAMCNSDFCSRFNC